MDTNNLTILAIDDDRDNLTALKAVVMDRLPGTRFLAAQDGQKGLEVAQAEDPNVILLNIAMPGMDGYTVCRKLKAHDRLQAAPVVFMTAAQTDRASRMKALEAGAEGFLSKPFDEVEVTAQIQAMAKIKAANQRQRMEREQLEALVAERTRKLNQELAERERAEKELREARTILDAALDHSLAGIAIADAPSGTLRYVNDAGLLISDIDRPTVVNGLGIDQYMASWQLFDLDDRPLKPDEVPLVRAIKFGEKCRGRFIIRRPIDDDRTVLADAAPIKNANGEVVAAIMVFMDISESKRAARLLEHRNRELELKNRELEMTLHAASHDLWSSLVNIRGFSAELDRHCRTIRPLVTDARSIDDLREHLATTLNEVVPGAVEFISASVKKMDALLAGLLRFSRLGQAALQPNLLDMNAMLPAITKTFEFQIREKGCTVQVGTLPPCFGDETQINQVFSNLLDNALKYLDPARSGAICVRGRQEKDWTTYCVEDNGIGIAPEDQDRVFDAFHRVNPEGPVTGEGLGLPLVRRILDNHGGKVRLESELGKGSRFFVSLPTKTK
jgi:signal transduction histidine kinase/DNA-binding response OmpR family regulator